MTSRILVTGGTGFVGSWLLDSLARSLPNATLFGSMRSRTIPSLLPSSVSLIPCEINDPEQVQHLVTETRPDIVYHLAGFSSATGTNTDIIRHANVDATLFLLQSLSKQDKPCRVLLASSGYVYGTTKVGQPAKEADSLNPAGLYGQSKAAMEQETRAFLASDPGAERLSVTIVRAFNHTGARQSDDFVVPAFARQIACIEAGQEEPVVRVGNLEARRDFLDVRDVIYAYRQLLESVEQIPLRTVNVSSGVSVTIRSLLDALVALSTVSVSVETDPARLRPSDLLESVGDNTFLRTLTSWQPEIPIEQMLEDTLNGWRAEVNRH